MSTHLGRSFGQAIAMAELPSVILLFDPYHHLMIGVWLRIDPDCLASELVCSRLIAVSTTVSGPITRADNCLPSVPDETLRRVPALHTGRLCQSFQMEEPT